MCAWQSETQLASEAMFRSRSERGFGECEYLEVVGAGLVGQRQVVPGPFTRMTSESPTPSSAARSRVEDGLSRLHRGLELRYGDLDRHGHLAE